MIKFLHKITSVFMAFVVLTTTMSFTIDEHYCGDTLMETAVFQKAKGCGMEMQQTSSEDCTIIKSNCCSDKHYFIEGQDELQLTFQKISFEQQHTLFLFFDVYLQSFQNNQETNSYLEYPPPLIVRQIFKLDESYLI